MCDNDLWELGTLTRKSRSPPQLTIMVLQRDPGLNTPMHPEVGSFSVFEKRFCELEITMSDQA